MNRSSLEPSARGDLDEPLRQVYDAEAELFLSQAGPRRSPRMSSTGFVATRVSEGHINDSDISVGIMMNLAVPPFDDLFVRRAAAYALNRSRLIEILGGPLTLQVAHHMVPDAMVTTCSLTTGRIHLRAT